MASLGIDDSGDLLSNGNPQYCLVGVEAIGDTDIGDAVGWDSIVDAW